jgi:hypothetical protein
MITRMLCATAVICGLFAMTSCGSSKNDKTTGGSTPEGGGVGAKCSADAQCTGYKNPVCEADLKPLENLVTTTDAKGQAFKDFHLPFPGGYCTNPVDKSCQADADCGQDGACFLPFDGVSQTTIDNLNALGLPFDVKQFATVGLCLKPCTDDSACRESDGYSCLVPIDGFLKLFNPSYAKKFCTVSVDDQISHLLAAPTDGG